MLNPRIKQRSRRSLRRGNILVLAAFLLVVVMLMVALAADVGYICLSQTELQRSVDSAALAGVHELVYGTEEAEAKATEYLCRNPVGSSLTFVDDAQLVAELPKFKT